MVPFLWQSPAALQASSGKPTGKKRSSGTVQRDFTIVASFWNILSSFWTSFVSSHFFENRNKGAIMRRGLPAHYELIFEIL